MYLAAEVAMLTQIALAQTTDARRLSLLLLQKKGNRK